MDPVSFAASVLTLSELSWKIVMYIQDVYQGGKSRDALLKEARELWYSLSQLHDNFKLTQDGRDAPSLKPLRRLWEPDGILNNMCKELKQLDDRFAKQTSRWKRIWDRVTWPLTEQETLRTVQQLHRLRDEANGLINQSTNIRTRLILGDTTKTVKVMDQEGFEKLLKWLSPLSFVQKSEEIINGLSPDVWLLGSDHFQPQFRS